MPTIKTVILGQNAGKNYLLSKHIIQSGIETPEENYKLGEFHFKLFHRIFVTKQDLFRFKIKEEGDCIYCGETDSIDHTI